MLQTIVPSRKNRHCPTGTMTMRMSTTTKTMCVLARRTTVLQAKTEIISKTMRVLLLRRHRTRAVKARLAQKVAIQTIIKAINQIRINTMPQMIKETLQTLLTIMDLTIKMLTITEIRQEAIWMTTAMVDA